MILNLYLFRHGETLSNLEKHLVGGRANSTPLSDLGKLQAKALGERLASEKITFDELYSSTAVRARDTTEIACKAMGFDYHRVILVENLVEMSQGDWEGRPRTECYTEETLKQIKEMHENFKAPNGESQKEAGARAYNWIRKRLIENRRTDADLCVGIFGHGLIIKNLIRRIMKSDPGLTYRIATDNCSITQFKYASEGRHQGWTVGKINDNAHLNSCGYTPNSFI